MVAFLASDATAARAGTGPAATPAAALHPPAIPVFGAYLGARPDATPGTASSVQAAALEKLTGKPLSIVSFYAAFGKQVALEQLDAVSAEGSIPMVSMHCGPPDASVAAGDYDSALESVALELKTFARPVFFRWFWEMNLPPSNQHEDCLGSNPATWASGYIAAFRHIRDIFREEGADNVAFVWAPSDAQNVHNQTSTFFPGAAYVDWIGADLFDRSLPSAKSFEQQFSSFYGYWSNPAHGDYKPIFVSETGAVGSPNQVTWFHAIYAALTEYFPEVKALLYVDADDMYNYILTPGTAGMKAFIALDRSMYFSDHAAEDGFVVTSAKGGVKTYGSQYYGSLAAKDHYPIVAVASARTGDGYWLTAANGSVFGFGAVRNHGSMNGKHLNRPIVGMTATPDGAGYWLVASDGGIFAFGDARFYGSMGGKHLNRPIVGITATPDGKGYWLVASDGGIFAFGDARFFGSTGAIHLNKPIVGMTTTPDSRGYWLVATDGGVFAFGDARFSGSLGATPGANVTGIAGDGLSSSYRLVTSAGIVYQYPGPVKLVLGAGTSRTVGIAAT